MMLAIGDTVGQCHMKLKDMMEWPGGGFNWSYTHNSPFKLSKTMLINFLRTFRDLVLDGLSLDWPNADGTVMTSTTLPVMSYKYLRVIFNPKLYWTLQHVKALTTTTFWASKLWHVLKSLSSMSTKGTKQLFNHSSSTKVHLWGRGLVYILA